MSDALLRWDILVRYVNNAPPQFGSVGVRDPEYPCALFDDNGYDGTGRCLSDGHYLCVDCSHLSPEAPRFVEHDEGRRERLMCFFATLKSRKASTRNTPGEG